MNAENNGWIKVEDALPENEDYVLTYSLVSTITKGPQPKTINSYSQDKKKWMINIPNTFDVTHWQPLPKRPLR